MKKSSYLAILFFLLVAGCKVISKQETKSVQALAKAMNTTASLPSQYIKQYYDVALESNQLLASIITNPSEKIEKLQFLIQDRIQADTIVKGYSSGYNVLIKYSELLSALTDDTSYQKELIKQRDAFIPSFDTLTAKYNIYNPTHKIPVTSLGGLASRIVQEIGSRRIRYLQRKYLKDLIYSADTIVSLICDQYNSVDLYKNDKQLASLSKTLDENYKTFMNFINLDSNNSNPYKYYKLYDPIYLDWKNKAVILSELNIKTSKAVTDIKKSHNQVKKLLDKKATFKEVANNLKILYASVNSLKESYQKFEKDLTPSK